MSEKVLEPKDVLSSLITSLSTLENSLETLLGNEAEEESSSSTWSEKLNKLDTMERAKMDILASYTINDLIWVYLKLKGVDPEKHDVTSELDRIKTYYSKVKSIEEPETQRKRIDSSAAQRFVKNSIPRSQHLPPTSAAQLANQQAQLAVAEQEAQSLKRVGKQGRFRFIEKEGTEKLIPGQGDEDGDENMDENMDGTDEEEDEGIVEGMDGEGTGEGEGLDADEFLKGVEEEMKGQ